MPILQMPSPLKLLRSKSTGKFIVSDIKAGLDETRKAVDRLRRQQE
jgi:hypothetical protein